MFDLTGHQANTELKSEWVTTSNQQTGKKMENLTVSGWERTWSNRTSTHCWWEHQLVQLFGEIHTIFWPSNSTSKYIPFGNIHTWTVLAHLLTSQKEKQTYIIRRINKLWSVHSMEYQTAQKMKTDGSYNAEWKMIKKNSCNPTHLYKM